MKLSQDFYMSLNIRQMKQGINTKTKSYSCQFSLGEFQKTYTVTQIYNACHAVSTNIGTIF